MFKQIAGHRFFTVDFGSGPRTFFTHSGWIGTYEDWLPTLEVMSKNWRVASFDHRGAGETTVPVEEITEEALLDDIFRVMDALAIDRCVLGGFSAGTGFTARAVLRDRTRFEGLVLMNGAAGVRPPDAGPPPPRRPPSTWPGEDHAARMRWFIEQCTPEPDVEHIRRWGHHFLLRAEPTAADRLNAIAPAADDDFVAALSQITIPTLIIHGEKDTFVTTAAMQYLSSLIPNTKLVVLDGSGHLPAMIRPHDVAAAITEFFDRPR
ncbi:MAG: alpha/beta hydrolase [Chloroflexi bacterium]|nr:alpha/beta hydrolase [Chloroflexota bacterium]